MTNLLGSQYVIRRVPHHGVKALVFSGLPCTTFKVNERLRELQVPVEEALLRAYLVSLRDGLSVFRGQPLPAGANLIHEVATRQSQVIPRFGVAEVLIRS